MGRRLSRAGHATALSLCILGSSGAARAQATSSDQAAAQALYDDAKALMGQKKFAEACKKLEESQRLDPGVGTHYAMADCYEQEGRLATAWVAFLDVASESQAQNRTDRVQEAKRRAGLLSPRLAKLTIHVPDAARAPGLSVKRDGEVVRDAQWGVDVPVDPGTHVVTAAAPGKSDWQASVEVRTEGKTFTVDVPVLQDAGTAQTPPPPNGPTPLAAQTPAEPSVPPAPGAEPTQGLGTQRVLALVAGGVALGGIAVGAIFGAQAMSKHSDSQSNCAANVCNPTGLQDTQDGQSAGNVSTIGFAVGGAALVGAAVLWFTAPKTRATSAAGVHAAPLVARDGGGFSLKGSW